MKRKLSLLLVLLMVLSLVPMTAFASGSVTATAVPVVSKANGVDLGMIRVVIPAGSRTAGEKLRVSIKNDVEFNAIGTATGVATATADVEVVVPSLHNGIANGLLLNPAPIAPAAAITPVAPVAGSTKTFEITFVNDVDFSNDGLIVIRLDNMDTSDAQNGNITVELDATPASGIPTGAVVVASVGGTDSAKATVSSTKTASEEFKFDLNLIEDRPGAIDGLAGLANGDRIKLKLPQGYAWEVTPGNEYANTAVTAITPVTKTDVKYGEAQTLVLDNQVEPRELILSFEVAGGALTSMSIKDLRFIVTDETKAKDGDIVVQVSTTGLDLNENEFVVGKKASFEASVELKDDAKTLYSAKDAQKIGDIVIEEGIAGSLINNRSVSIKLPNYAKWNIANAGDTTKTDEGRTVTATPSTNGELLRFVPSGAATSEGAKLTFKDWRIDVEPGYEGDIVAELIGDQGIRGEMLIAQVVKPVEMTTTTTLPEVVIGRSNQAAADFTIIEAKEGMFETTVGSVTLALPAGVRFAKRPTVKVTDKDLDISDVAISVNPVTGKGEATFNVSSESYKASTITVTDLEITVDRTVPEGDITLEIMGGDIVEALLIAPGMWPNAVKANEVAIAKVVTPAQGQNGQFEDREEVKFTIGQKTFTVGDQVVTADVAPFIQDSRTMVPVSFVAQAVGVPASNIVWDGTTRTVTIFGERVIQLQIGSNELLVSGARINMDTEAIISGDRTFVPIAWIAQALAVDYTWDAVDKTVTFN